MFFLDIMIVKYYHYGMKLITKDTDYAIRILCFLAEKEEHLYSVADLSQRFKIPNAFLRLVLQILNKKNFLSSYKGKGGGFKLAMPPQKIFIIDLIEIFQGPIKFKHCFIKKELCTDIQTCPLRKKIEEIEDHVYNKFKSITIDSLVNEQV